MIRSRNELELDVVASMASTRCRAHRRRLHDHVRVYASRECTEEETARPFDAGFGYLWGGDLDYAGAEAQGEAACESREKD